MVPNSTTSYSLQLQHRPSWLPSPSPYSLKALPHRPPYNYHRIIQYCNAGNGTQPIHAKQVSPAPSPWCGVWISLYRNQGPEDPELFKVKLVSLRRYPAQAGQNGICYTLNCSYSLAHCRILLLPQVLFTDASWSLV